MFEVFQRDFLFNLIQRNLETSVLFCTGVYILSMLHSRQKYVNQSVFKTRRIGLEVVLGTR
jgi:hypothetical protein